MLPSNIINSTTSAKANLMKIFTLFLPLFLVACSNPHKDCIDADKYGHCNQWKGQPVSCKERTILGLCKNDHPNSSLSNTKSPKLEPKHK